MGKKSRGKQYRAATSVNLCPHPRLVAHTYAPTQRSVNGVLVDEQQYDQKIIWKAQEKERREKESLDGAHYKAQGDKCC